MQAADQNGRRQFKRKFIAEVGNIRRHLDLSLRQLAEMTSVSVGTISNIEMGKDVKDSTLQKLAKPLHSALRHHRSYGAS